AFTPCGFFTYRTGSPLERNSTPWNRLGKNPLCHCREAIGCCCPERPVERSTTKPGKLSLSLPSPYHSHEPIAGRPEMVVPVFINVWAGSWLIASVRSERTMHSSSATPARCGKTELISWPDRPHLRKGCWGAKQWSCFPWS